MAGITLGGVGTSIEIVTFIAEQWLKHKREEEGLTTEQALAQADANYAAAQAENDDLKQAGHDPA